MEESNSCRKSLNCTFAILVVFLAFLVQFLVVGLFFVLPYYKDCDRSQNESPLQSSACFLDSPHSSLFLLPTPFTNYSMTVPYCFESHCYKRETGCIPKARCCCRPVPQTKTVTSTNGALDVSLNASCVYAVCDNTAHTVLLQVYDASELNSTSRTGISGLYLQFGSYTPEATDANGTVTFNPVYEGDYAVTVLAGDHTSISADYFHASTLSINFYSTSQVVYIVYVKNLTNAANTPTLLNCSISSDQGIRTVVFNNELYDLITLPNNFIFNGTFFEPKSVAFTNATQRVNISISCNTSYTLFYYTKDGEWKMDNTSTLFSLSSSVLWSLAVVTDRTAYTVYINPGTSPLILDRGSVLVLTRDWFVSRVTSHNRTILSVPFVSTSDINIRYTTSSYSHLIASSPIVELGSLSTLDFTKNCSTNRTNTHDLVDTVSAVLSVTNSPNLARNCYHPINVIQNNQIQNVTFALSLRSGNSIVYFSTLQTNTNYACLPFPCQMADYRCEITATNQEYALLVRENCTVASNSLELLECNTELQNLKSQS